MRYFSKKSLMDLIIFAVFITIAMIGLGLSLIPKETDGFGYAALIEKVKRCPALGQEIRSLLQRDGMITESEYEELSARHPRCITDRELPQRAGLEAMFSADAQKRALMKVLGQL
jgi:hypothetical protein